MGYQNTKAIDLKGYKGFSNHGRRGSGTVGTVLNFTTQNRLRVESFDNPTPPGGSPAGFVKFSLTP